MSSLYVRRKARAWAAVLPNAKYMESINVEEDIDGVPVALVSDFVSDGIQKSTYCGDEVETGSITLSWIGRAGIGDDALLVAAEADSALFYANKDPKLTLISRTAPDTVASVGGQMPRFIVDISYDYEYRP